MNPLLSILVATVPKRVPSPFSELFHNLCTQANGKLVEVLAFADNRQRTLGEKMNGLLALANGCYTVFVDDDDTVSPEFVNLVLDEIIARPWVHVINYQIRVSLPEGDGFVYPSLANPNQEFSINKVTLRKPMQTSVWRSDLSKTARWPEGQYNVDAAWAAQLWAQATTERYIPETLYHYRRNQIPTEAV